MIQWVTRTRAGCRKIYDVDGTDETEPGTATPSGACTDPHLAIFGLLFVFPHASPGSVSCYHTTGPETHHLWIAAHPEGDKIATTSHAPVAQLDRASAFEAQPPVPKLPFFNITLQCLQQLGESASRSKLSSTPRIDIVLAQFWHS